MAVERPAQLRIVILQDISGSANSIPRLSTADLNRLVTHIATHGGELAFTTVGESVPALVRLRLHPPCQPSLDLTSTNVFVVARQRAAIEGKWAAFQEELARYQAASEPRIQAFTDTVTAMLERTARQTLLHDALRRVSIALHEPSPFPNTQSILIVISDGQDTSKKTAPIALDCDRVLMVAANADLGLMRQWHDQITLFENPNAAITHLLGGPQ